MKPENKVLLWGSLSGFIYLVAGYVPVLEYIGDKNANILAVGTLTLPGITFPLITAYRNRTEKVRKIAHLITSAVIYLMVVFLLSSLLANGPVRLFIFAIDGVVGSALYLLATYFILQRKFNPIFWLAPVLVGLCLIPTMRLTIAMETIFGLPICIWTIVHSIVFYFIYKREATNLSDNQLAELQN